MSLNKIEDRVYDLLSQKLSGDADAACLQELDDLMKKYPQFQFLHDQLIKLNNQTDEQGSTLTDQAYAAHYVKMIYANEEKVKALPLLKEGTLRRKPAVSKLLMAALSVAAVVAIIVFYSGYKKSQAGLKNDSSIITADTRSKVMLPDGTTVVLNSDSKIDYDKGFNGKERRVVLTGEAYFDVAHNPGKPFIVHTSTADIQVYGTRFNVKNYDKETWETTLLTGKVEVRINNAAKEKFVLKPSQKLSIIKAGINDGLGQVSPEGDEKIVISKYTKVESQVAETSWIDDKMVFADKPLYEIAGELERHFHITVSFNSEATKMYRYTGVFSKQSLAEVLQILDMSRPIKYKLTDQYLQID